MLTHCPKCRTYKPPRIQQCRCGYDFTAELVETSDFETMGMSEAEERRLGQEMWRSGKLLVIRKGAEFPDRCVKTNQPVQGKRHRQVLSWHHPSLYFLIFAGWLIYLIVALSVQKKAIIYFGVTEQILQRRRRNILLTWASGFISLSFILYCVSLPNPMNGAVLLVPLIGVIGMIVGASRTVIVQVDYMKDDYIWIRGICQEYLDLLPEWEPFV
jgi:hypothetical protein